MTEIESARGDMERDLGKRAATGKGWAILPRNQGKGEGFSLTDQRRFGFSRISIVSQTFTFPVEQERLAKVKAAARTFRQKERDE
jgi:hypothetical protein